MKRVTIKDVIYGDILKKNKSSDIYLLTREEVEEYERYKNLKALGISVDYLVGISSVKKRQTNADRIRNMSDDELAKFITSMDFDCADYCDSFASGCAFNCGKKDREIALKWLQSEAE